jgi:hypothetical protein
MVTFGYPKRFALTDERSFVMRKTSQLKSTSRGIESSELSRVSGSSNLSVSNLIVSIGVTDSTAGNIDTALQLGPR